MPTTPQQAIEKIFTHHQPAILEGWMCEQLAALTARQDLMSTAALRTQSQAFLALFTLACRDGGLVDITGTAWEPVLDFLADLSRQRAKLGFTPSETATFVFSLKQPVFARVREALGANVGTLVDDLWTLNVLLDKLGLYTMEVFLNSRESVIKSQQLDMLELSTPVLNLWQDIVAVPLIGTLDSSRMQAVMENLLGAIAKHGCPIAIVDVTGVPIVDTQVAQHLLKTAAAARLMGAHCIICGISAPIAQTMVELGVPFGGIDTRATLADALAQAFTQTRRQVVAFASPVC
jgi:rsbT co-antagonist protein RsbR